MNQIDFKLIASAALSRTKVLLPQWLPGGDWAGDEYKALNPTRSDGRKGSFSINAKTGVWSDFAIGESGGDLIALHAYLFGLQMAQSAREIAELVGIDLIRPKDGNKQINTASDGDKSSSSRTAWKPIMPAPDDAGVYPVAHVVRGIPERIYVYRDSAGKVLGVIYRFVTSDGGKEILPCCFAEHPVSGKREWRWMGFPTPRPLYGLDKLHENPDLPVLLVEGEKCANAANLFLAKHFVAVTWPGGSKAINKVDWSPLHGRKVYAWADCDAKRDKQDKFLPESEQPGMKAMIKIKSLLGNAEDFQLIDIPLPGDKPDGWDIADAIEEGMPLEDIYAFIQNVINPTYVQSKPKPQRKSFDEQDGSFKSVIERYALIYSTETVYDVDVGIVMSIASMRYAMGKDTVDNWLKNADRKMILPNQLVFDPTDGCLPPNINLFRGFEMQPKRGDYAAILELLQHLCADSAESDQGVLDIVDWVIKWLALPLQHQGTKMRSALVFHGPQGAGKNLFFEIIAAIYGKYSIVVGQEHLEEKHNDWCSSKLFMIGDEVIARQELYHQKNKLKAFITGETIQINPKFLPIRTERNYINVVFLSNEDQPLALEESDRRYFVVYTPPERKDDLYQRVDACIANGGIEAFYDYLLNVDLDGFAAFSRPPMTIAKRDLIDLGLKPEQRFIYEWINGYLPIFLAPCSAGQLYRLFQYWATRNGERAPPQKTFTGNVRNFVKVLSKQRDRDDQLIDYKVVKLPKNKYGQTCERCWIPHDYVAPDTKTEGESMEEAMDQFEKLFQSYVERGRSCEK